MISIYKAKKDKAVAFHAAMLYASAHSMINARLSPATVQLSDFSLPTKLNIYSLLSFYSGTKYNLT